MTLKKLMVLFIRNIGCLVLFSNIALGDEGNSGHLKKIEMINQYFTLDKEALPYKEVLDFSRDIIKNRKNYNNDAIAKVYILLANVATNKGDIARAFQFAVDGLELPTIDPAIKLNLMLKVADGYYDKGKHYRVLDIANQAIELAEQTSNIKYQLIAFSYRSMAFALLAKYQQAINDLYQVEKLISEHKEFSNHLELLNILAVAHYYLGDFQTTVAIYQNIIKTKGTNQSGYQLE